ncbi:MAG: LamG domain-containing protein, partial [Candidatus Parabeggiatoa sp.]|nr:LamG domain-containing protein [Candidatus Parabeggiatoa sp.]
VSKYKYSGFDYVIGVPDLVSDVTPEIEQAREALAVEYEKRLVDLDKVGNLLQYTLPDEREQKMTALQDALKNDVESLSQAGVVCFNDLGNWLAEKCEVFKTLVSYDPKELALQLDDGLLLHLPFDGDLSDVSWHQNHGLLQAGRLTYTNEAISGKAAYFDGSTVVNIPNTEQFRFANSSFTFSVWVDVIDNPGFYRGYISLSDNFYKRIELAKYRVTDKGPAQIYMQIYMSTHREVGGLDSGATLQKKGWLHLVSVVDQAQGNMRLYINGIKQGAAGLVNFNLLDPRLSIGSCVINKDAPCRHKGPMDEVRIWDRALSEGEIEGLYNAGKK